MPTTYAHWRFGVDCIETLPQELKKIILENRELFDFGVHGPDVFFYDLRHPELPAYGHHMHQESARTFFDKAVEVYKQYDEDKDAMLSYMLGFLSHFALDSQCHAYINSKDLSSDILTHNKVESEYDGHLIRMDGRSIARTDRAASLKPSKTNAAIMARFFPYSPKEMLRTSKGQKMLLTLLNCKSDLKRNGATAVFNKLGMRDYRDLIVQKEEMQLCKDSNLRIDKLKAYALEVYPDLAKQLMAAIEKGEELGPYFDLNFDPQPDERTPVLSYEEELEFIPVKFS
ncbi:MAG: zinc dependent phospholipase C family protein [Erysipelotrichaceae bacterium]|nr:zinc dependent phospholipase C family protein [Erysipelotrichaceae bacterium]